MFDIPSAWVPAVAAFFVVALGVICLSLVWEGLRRARKEREVGRRLAEISRLGMAADTQTGPGSLFRDESEDARGFAGLLVYLPRREDLRRLLEQADSSWGAGTFVLLTLGLAAAAAVMTALFGFGPFGAILAAVFGALLPYMQLRRQRTRRAAAFEEHFPDAIELLARSLRAGHAMLTGLEVVAQEAPPPVNREFRQVYEQQRFGLSLRESMLSLADRVDTVDVRMFVTSVMIQRESGGNLAEILDNLATLIRERFKFRRQLRTHTAQGRMTGYLLAVLPIAVGLILFTINRDYMIVLITEPAGRMMILGAVVLQILGFLWIRKIVDIEF